MSPQGDNGPTVDRRTTIKWLAATMFAAGPGCSSSGRFMGEEIPPAPASPNTLLGTAGPTAAAGYGKDPGLVDPLVPWPRTMTADQLRAAAALSDVILPADEQSPAASALGVHHYIDEWVSAPYPQQQDDRVLILDNLEWLEQQSRDRCGAAFAGSGPAAQEALVASIATPSEPEPTEQNRFFARFRYLAVGAFYTTQEGIADIGYIGNVPLSGNYPGPGTEAMAHLAGVLRQLDLPVPV